MLFTGEKELFAVISLQPAAHTYAVQCRNQNNHSITQVGRRVVMIVSVQIISGLNNNIQ